MSKHTALLIAALAAVEANAAVITKVVEYKDGDVTLKGFLAYDDAVKGKRAGVLIVHEWWGLNDYTKSRAKQLAELGYVAFACDMYGAGVNTTKREEAQSLCGKISSDTAALRKRVRVGLDQLTGNELCDAKRVAAIGYCFGGTTVLNLAYSGADIAGVVSFHGGLQPPKDGDTIKAKILVCHGADDGFIPADQIKEFQDGVRKLKADWQMVYYGNAVHSFTNPGAKGEVPGAVYDKAADERSWAHMRAFFKEIFHEK